MDNIIKEMVSIKTSTRNMKRLSLAALCVAGLVCVASVGFSLHYASKMSDNIYILDRGEAATATRGVDDSQRSFEVQDHVVRFHELLLNLAPSAESIRINIDRALMMCDRSAYNYWQDLSEQGFYRRLVSANISQQFVVDSVKANMGVYPYAAKVYGKLYLIRESNITAYEHVSTCRLVDVARSKSNPHGLMIENFEVTSQEKIETRRRQ